MKKTIYMYSMLGVFSVGLLVIAYFSSTNTRAENKLKRMGEAYYIALQEERYEDALEQLYLYEGHYTDGPSGLVKQEATERFMQKVALLKAQHFSIKDFTLGKIEYEDSHSFWLHVRLVMERNGQLVEVNDVVDEYEGKLIVGGDDPFVDYRNGKMAHYIGD